MGATNNKPLRTAPPRRRRRFNPRNLLRKRTENEGNDFSNYQQGGNNYLGRGNVQDNNFDPGSIWADQHQVYQNGQNYDFRSGNVSANNFGYQEAQCTWNQSNIVNIQFPNTEYSQDGTSSDYNVIRNEQNSDQSYLNRISQPVGDYNSTSTGQPIRPIMRRHSLNNGLARAQFNQFSQNSHRYQVQSYSLNNVNCGERSFGLTNYASDTNVYHNSYRHHWRGSGMVDTAVRRCNSVNAVYSAGNVFRGGRKRNSLDEDFYGEDFCGRSSQDLYGSQGLIHGNVDANYDGPRVKRRPTSESQEGNYERSNSAQSFREATPSSDNTDFAYDNLDIESNQSDEQTNVLNILEIPPVWSSYSVNKTGFVDIPSTSVEGEKLSRFFHKTSRTREFQLRIIGIERIENPFLHTLYMLKKEEMKLRNEHVDELHLYHGTKEENIANICEDNFNWRLSEKHKFGQGLSFSPFATYSSHYCDNSDIKVMLLLKVLVSNAVFGAPDMEIPPIIDNITYDTSIKEDTSVIVKYSDNEFYPLYKITYRKCPIK